jgi:hypothetical protein
MSNRTSLKSLAIATAITAAAVFLVVVATPGRAEAQVGTGGILGTVGTGGSGGTAFAAGDFFTSIQQQSDPPVSLTTFELSRFFNKANCDCSTPVNVFIALLSSGVAKRQTAGITTGTVSIVLGTGCNNVQNLQTGTFTGSCLQIASEPVLTFLSQAQYTVATDARTLSTFINQTGAIFDGGTNSGTGTGTATACTSPIGQSFTQTINFNFDFGSGGIDLSVPFSMLIDVVPPPPPAAVRIQGGDEALVMNWTAVDQALVPDLLGYQILCSRADQYQVFNETPTNDGGTSTGSFGSAFQVCPKIRAAMGGLDAGIENLNPLYVCSPQLSAQATSDRVEILQNDITYAAAVVAIDSSGNPSEPVIGYGKPVKTLSFYDVYRDQTPQGQATGGFCAISTGRSGAKTTAAGLSLLAVTAIGVVITRRRRRRR